MTRRFRKLKYLPNTKISVRCTPSCTTSTPVKTRQLGKPGRSRPSENTRSPGGVLDGTEPTLRLHPAKQWPIELLTLGLDRAEVAGRFTGFVVCTASANTEIASISALFRPARASRAVLGNNQCSCSPFNFEPVARHLQTHVGRNDWPGAMMAVWSLPARPGLSPFGSSLSPVVRPGPARNQNGGGAWPITTAYFGAGWRGFWNRRP